MYLYYTLWFINQLFQLVNIEMTHTYCRVTMKYVDCSYGQALIYIHQWHEARNRCVEVYWKYIIKSIKLTNGLILRPFILYDVTDFSGYLIQLALYINSLRQVSHHHIMCTKFHLFVETKCYLWQTALQGRSQTITLPYVSPTILLGW